MKRKKSISIRIQLILMSVLPVIATGAILIIMTVSKLHSGMMDEALEGLMASAEMFREQIAITDMDLTTNQLGMSVRRPPVLISRGLRETPELPHRLSRLTAAAP